MTRREEIRLLHKDIKELEARQNELFDKGIQCGEGTRAYEWAKQEFDQNEIVLGNKRSDLENLIRGRAKPIKSIVELVNP